MAVHGAAAAMRGSSSRADIKEQALACALAQTSFPLLNIAHQPFLACRYPPRYAFPLWCRRR
jgi:hypothetical protein